MHELLYLKDDQIKEFIEKLFFAYRESFSDAKKALNKHSLGLAHHKVTETGKKLFEEIFSFQKKRIYKALLKSSSKEVLCFDNVIERIINEKV